MPQIINTVDAIMAREKRDMFFIRFDWPFNENPDHPSRKQHFDWFAAHGLRHEVAAPRGWLEGDPGCHAVYFDGPDDPRVAQYAAAFENATGKSLDPDAYQMVLLPYRSWLDGRRSDGGDEEPDGNGPPWVRAGHADADGVPGGSGAEPGRVLLDTARPSGVSNFGRAPKCQGWSDRPRPTPSRFKNA